MPKQISKAKHKEIVKLWSQDINQAEIAYKLGISIATVGRHLRKEAAKEAAPQVTPEISKEVSDPFERLAEAQAKYEDAISQFVYDMNAKLIEASKARVNQLEQENAELKQVIAAAKDSNLVTNLKRHFGIIPPTYENN